MGTDFNGAINPINYFISEEDMLLFITYLQLHISEYINDSSKLINSNKISPEVIIKKITSKNMLRFYMANY